MTDIQLLVARAPPQKDPSDQLLATPCFCSRVYPRYGRMPFSQIPTKVFTACSSSKL